MKISIVLTEKAKQIMLTPETDHERKALRMIAPGDVLKTAVQWGTFEDKPTHASYEVLKSRGGNYRRYATEDSLMFIIEDP